MNDIVVFVLGMCAVIAVGMAVVHFFTDGDTND